MQVTDHVTEIRTRVRSLTDLPPMPAVAQKLLTLLTNENVELDEVARTIEMDPGPPFAGPDPHPFFRLINRLPVAFDIDGRFMGQRLHRKIRVDLTVEGLQQKIGGQPGK